jgi:hypothetical protein
MLAIDRIQIAIPSGGEAAARAFFVGLLGMSGPKKRNPQHSPRAAAAGFVQAACIWIRYTNMKRFRGIIVIVLLVAAWIAAECLMYRRTVPPASVADFPTFAKWQQSPRGIEVIQQGGTDHLLAVGPGGGPRGRAPVGFGVELVYGGLRAT